MNLLERNNSEKEEQDREKKKQERERESGKRAVPERKYAGPDKEERNREWKEPKIPVILILSGIIVVLFLCIIVLLVVPPNRRESDDSEALQQNMLDYANEQKQNDNVAADTTPTSEIIVVEPSEVPDEPEAAAPEQTTPENPEETKEETYTQESNTIDKTAIVVDIEDEDDISYTKEFIMNEMMPYFADNNLDAVWDLAHLKRYVKLSAGLKNTNSYYYQGGTDSSGKPDGIGLAIYENNTYYYGSWSHGVRSGDGRWIRFYIDEIGAKTTKKVYQAHSYSGMWSNDLPNGEGAEHYEVDITQASDNVIQNVVGNFTNGLYDGEMYANTIDYLGNVQEWDGIAHQGVFELWRDMSSIGECAVWRCKTDPEECLDIDKSENKNQGMRELLVSGPAK